MAIESKQAKIERAFKVFSILTGEYPDACCALEHQNVYQLSIATILSAQTTDERVNMVTPELFDKYQAPQDLANADQKDVENIIRSTGFFRNKAKNIIGFARGVIEEHGGEVPCTMLELSALPGVGRKTANVILGNAFGVNEGVAVDTHVRRLSNLLGFTKENNPEKIERDLMSLFPSDRWTILSHLLIFNGRQVCHSRKPHCEACALSHLCPSSRV